MNEQSTDDTDRYGLKRLAPWLQQWGRRTTTPNRVLWR